MQLNNNILFFIFFAIQDFLFILQFTTFAQALSIISFLITIFSSFQHLFLSGKKIPSIVNKQSRIYCLELKSYLAQFDSFSRKVQFHRRSRFIIVFFYGAVIAQNIIINKFAWWHHRLFCCFVRWESLQMNSKIC